LGTVVSCPSEREARPGAQRRGTPSPPAVTMTRRIATAAAAVLAASAALPAPAAGQAPEPGFDLSVRSIMRGPALVGRSPDEVRFSDDARWVYFRWRAGEPSDTLSALWRVPVEGGAPERLADSEAERVVPAPGTEGWSADRSRRAFERGATSGCGTARPASGASPTRRGGSAAWRSRPTGGRSTTWRGQRLRRGGGRRAAPAAHGPPHRGRAAAGRHGRAAGDAAAAAGRALRRGARPGGGAQAARGAGLAPRRGPSHLPGARNAARLVLRLPVGALPAAGHRRAARGGAADPGPRVGDGERLHRAAERAPKVGDTVSTQRVAILDLEAQRLTWVQADSALRARRVALNPAGWAPGADRALVVGIPYDFKDRWIWTVGRTDGSPPSTRCATAPGWGGRGLQSAGWLSDERVYFVSERTGTPTSTPPPRPVGGPRRSPPAAGR
jgi:hypothetical protein